MIEWQLRVVDEKKELDVKIQKLYEFLPSDNFKSLNAVNRHLLVEQCKKMQEYSHILGERIDLFGSVPGEVQ